MNFKEKSCLTCLRVFRPLGGSQKHCCLFCRFLDNCHIPANPDDCWVWPMVRDKVGYGRINVNNLAKFAHRVSYSCFNDLPLDNEFVVMHVCDNPPCCNPTHLRIGTQAENVQDMFLKGRQATEKDYTKGSTHYMATIDESTALAIFTARGTPKAIAQSFGVSRYVVEKIKYGTSWNHVTGMQNRRKKC